MKKETSSLNDEIKQTDLPLIVGAGKKASKTETPLEKEMRRFNKMIEEINQHEENQKKKQQQEDQYHQLYQSKVIPAYTTLAAEKLHFLKQLHDIFVANTYTKREQRNFVDFVLAIIHDILPYNDEARQFAHYYVNLDVALMNKAEKKQFQNEIKENVGFDVDMDDFDAETIYEQSKGRNASGASYKEEDGEDEFKFDEDFFTPPPKKKNNSAPKPEEIELQTLYKELAKQIHPDLEPDEDLKKEKLVLMQELIQARKEHNLFMMLLIKSKAHQLNGTSSNTAYSLDKLKLYNKQLKRKLAEMKDEIAMVHFSNLFMHNGKITIRQNQPAEERVNHELKQVKKQLKDLKNDKEIVTTHDMLKQFIQQVC